MTRPVYILVVEDDVNTRRSWVDDLRDDGVDIGGQRSNMLAADVDSLHVFSFGMHQIHLVGTQAVMDQAVRAYDYDVCFADNQLHEGTSYDPILYLLQNASTKVVSISGDACDHCSRIEEAIERHGLAPLEEGRLIAGDKQYDSNRELLAKRLGFRTGGVFPTARGPQGFRMQCIG